LNSNDNTRRADRTWIVWMSGTKWKFPKSLFVLSILRLCGRNGLTIRKFSFFLFFCLLCHILNSFLFLSPQECAAGLYYNAPLDICDWPSNVNCILPTSSDKIL
jgi:hypothetical protein